MEAVEGDTPIKDELRKLSAPTDVGRDAFLAAAVAPADESRERLLSFMVHEIRNPLASALWAAEMLARKSLGDSRNDRLSQLAARSVRRLRTLLEDLFALERVPLNPSPGRSDLGEAIVRALAPHDLEPEGIRATVDAEAGIVVAVEPILLDRLLHACLRRMLHGGPGGSLSVKLLREESMALLSITREGACVESVDPPLLTSRGSEGDGTTFALLVARAIAQRLGVALWVEPTPNGAVIRLGFPLERHPAP